jgi:arylsulfatase A-like enzyme
VRVTRAWAERQAAAALPTPTPGAPNVLLIVLDTVRSSNLGLYGYDRPTTPVLQRWAADSVVFENAITTAPWTLPSHGSLFTGRAPGALHVGFRQPLPEAPPTLAEAFGSHGYASAGFVANLLYTSYESGLSRGFVHYDDYRVSWPLVYLHSSLTRIDLKSTLPQARTVREGLKALAGSHVAPDGWEPPDVFRPADRVAAAFLDWQSTVTNRPFFAFMNFYDAHGPYRAPEAFIKQFARARGGSDVDRYDAAIAWTDHVIGTVLESLKQRGVLDNTIVIVTADHGEHFGEHGLTDHANSLYLPLLHVPLMIRYPAGVPAGRRVSTLVSLRDLPATILELAGIRNAAVPGTSLSQTWKTPGRPIQGDIVAELGKGINVDPVFRNYRGDAAARLDERFHYIRNGDGTEELFDYRADPQELQNLVNDPARQPDVVHLRGGLPFK